jgi:hypothetical protein
VFPLKPDLCLGGVERIEAHFYGVTGQIRRGLIKTVVQQERGIAAYQAIEAMEEKTTQVGGRRELTDVFDIALPARDGRGLERAVLTTGIQ